MLCFEDRTAPFVDVFRASAIAAGYDLVLTTPLADDDLFREFQSHYRHLSVNPIGFELACFQRYFSARLLSRSDERFIIADSDLLVMKPFERLPHAVKTFDHGLIGSVGVTDGITETDVSPHFSFWTGELVNRFCEYLVTIYRSGDMRLEAIGTTRLAGSRRVAISDMTLLHLWIGDEGIPFLDTNRVIDDAHIDHNISVTHCSNARFRSSLGRKSVLQTRDGLMFMTTDRAMVSASVIHLQGRYKRGALALASGDMNAFRMHSFYIKAGRWVRTALTK